MKIDKLFESKEFENSLCGMLRKNINSAFGEDAWVEQYVLSNIVEELKTLLKSQEDVIAKKRIPQFLAFEEGDEYRIVDLAQKPEDSLQINNQAVVHIFCEDDITNCDKSDLIETLKGCVG